MPTKKKKPHAAYPAELIAKMLAKVVAGKPIKDVAKEHNIGYGLLCSWIDRARKNPKFPFAHQHLKKSKLFSHEEESRKQSKARYATNCIYTLPFIGRVRFPRELKLEIVRKIIAGTRVFAVSMEYGVEPAKLYIWVKQYKTLGPDACFPGWGNSGFSGKTSTFAARLARARALPLVPATPKQNALIQHLKDREALLTDACTYYQGTAALGSSIIHETQAENKKLKGE